ncbi:terminase small subunit [Mesorhizobium sp. M4A.F.Ca.ET.020.02.1.1]|uniref:terminase small subunit n=1 Tax=Mesorhizobium sp. M4A.F.Ca.ET.020.02.1.1 TaxID=2496652 RepID=UPI000FD36B6B|nr:terminase small subunit [Mesorhizobium sp. M4A.F.Ca.ET.020.02.1.1]RVD42860.1 terminase small subunit [Mesorhizobium sp. M4A.F.Ca.ET.020.02.1.1]
MTPKQEQFVREYLIDLNATQAAIRAGYSAGKDNRNAQVQGERMLSNAEIKAAINAAKIERSAETKIDAAWVLNRLAIEAQADMADLYTETGAIKPVHEWPLIWRQGLVAGIKHQELRDSEGNRTGEFIVDIKVSDRIRRLELIGKHIGVKAFEEQVNVTGLDALADRLARAAKRTGD